MANKSITLHPIVNGQRDDSVDLYPRTSQDQVKGLSALMSATQDELVSGQNIKTVNGDSLLGGGNMSITAPAAPTATAADVERLFATEYQISVSVSNGTYTGDSSIWTGGTASVTIVPNSGYSLPSAVSVVGASHNYSDVTGVVSLFTPTAGVSVSATCRSTSTTYHMYGVVEPSEASDNPVILSDASFTASDIGTTEFTIDAPEGDGYWYFSKWLWDGAAVEWIDGDDNTPHGVFRLIAVYGDVTFTAVYGNKDDYLIIN